MKNEQDGFSVSDRDLYWMIFILTCIIIGFASIKYGCKDNDIVSYVGFAGTLSSIILSVLAIFVTFADRSFVANQFNKLSQISDRFDLSADRLEEHALQTRKIVTDTYAVVAELPDRIQQTSNRISPEGSIMDGASPSQWETIAKDLFEKLQFEKIFRTIYLSQIQILEALGISEADTKEKLRIYYDFYIQRGGNPGYDFEDYLKYLTDSGIVEKIENRWKISERGKRLFGYIVSEYPDYRSMKGL